MGSRQWRLVAAALLAVAGIVAVPGCYRCADAQITVTPIERSNLDEPVTVEAQLSSSEAPVATALVTFYLLSQGPDSRWKGQAFGSSVTDANGVAGLTYGAALSSLAAADHVIGGYGADFRTPTSGPGGTQQLCATQGRFDFT